jgi:hypothetical protein
MRVRDTLLAACVVMLVGCSRDDRLTDEDTREVLRKVDEMLGHNKGLGGGHRELLELLDKVGLKEEKAACDEAYRELEAKSEALRELRGKIPENKPISRTNFEALKKELAEMNTALKIYKERTVRAVDLVKARRATRPSATRPSN